jgi:hypothetical protein
MKYIIEKTDGNSIVHQILNESQIDFFTKNMAVFKIFDRLPEGGNPSNVFWSGNQEDGIEIKPDFDLNLAKTRRKAEIKTERDIALSNYMIDMGNNYYISFDTETMAVFNAWIAQTTAENRMWSAWAQESNQKIEAGRREFSRAEIESACNQYILADEKYYNATYLACDAIDVCSIIAEVEAIKLTNYL